MSVGHFGVRDIALSKSLKVIQELISLHSERIAENYNLEVRAITPRGRGGAVNIDEFPGPYDLELGYDQRKQVLKIKFTSVANAGLKARREVPFDRFVSQIEGDRSMMSAWHQQVSQHITRPNVLEVFDAQYKKIHGLNARTLMELFMDARIDANNNDFYKGLYALLRLIVPLGVDKDISFVETYANIYKPRDFTGA